MCTLLGPEGPERLGRNVLVGLFLLDVCALASLAGVEGYRPYFENYTVDASILNLCPSGSNYKDQNMCLRVCVRSLVNFCRGFVSVAPIDSNSCDFKFLRANGECLGM